MKPAERTIFELLRHTKSCRRLTARRAFASTARFRPSLVFLAANYRCAHHPATMIMVTKLAGLVLAVCAVRARADCPAVCTAPNGGVGGVSCMTGANGALPCHLCCDIEAGATPPYNMCLLRKDDPDGPCKDMFNPTATGKIYDWCVPSCLGSFAGQPLSC